MVDYKKLKDELTVDPLTRGYSGMSDQQVVDSLTLTVDRPVVNDMNVGSLGIMREIGPTLGATILDKLEAAATVDSRLKWFMKELNTNGVDIGNAVTRATIDDLVTNSVITAAEGASLKGIPEKTVSRAEELGFSELSDQVINNARTLSW